MSRMFRPVIEKWGESQDVFIEPDALLTLLRALDYRIASAEDKFSACESEYGDVSVFTIHEGEAFIALVATLTYDLAAALLADQGVYEIRDDLEALVGNMQLAASSGEWTRMLDDGVLRFYID